MARHELCVADVLHAAASLLGEADTLGPTPTQTTQRELWALGQ